MTVLLLGLPRDSRMCKHRLCLPLRLYNFYPMTYRRRNILFADLQIGVIRNWRSAAGEICRRSNCEGQILNGAVFQCQGLVVRDSTSMNCMEAFMALVLIYWYYEPVWRCPLKLFVLVWYVYADTDILRELKSRYLHCTGRNQLPALIAIV